MTALALASAALLAGGWATGSYYGKPWEGLAYGLICVIGILIFAGGGE